MKRCPVCSSPNVRRSGVRMADAHSHPFRSPYRCHDCDGRFWVVSRRARISAAAGGAVALMIVLFLGLPMVMRHQRAQVPVEPAAAYPSQTLNSIDSLERRRVDDIIKWQSGAIDRQLQSRGETSR